MIKQKAVVIGSGFSGLSAACFLARDGADVVVLEQHEGPGGRARQLQEGGFTFDMGPSWYWMPDIFDRFFAAFGKRTGDYYELVRLDPSYRVYWPEGPIDIPADFEALQAVFEGLEPGSAAQLRRYLAGAQFKYETGMHDLVYRPGKSLREFASLPLLKGLLRLQVFTPARRHIRQYFRHPKLQQLMEFPLLFLGALPEETPALYSLMNYADLKLGTWYPMGGMYRVVAAMYELALSLGVKFHFGHRARHIRVAGGKATGVETDQGFFAADAVVGSADYHFIETALLPPECRSYSTSYWDSRTMAPSCLIYYVGLDRRVDAIRHHNLFFDAPFGAHAHAIYKEPAWPEQPLFYLSCTSRTDGTVAPAGGENLFILIPTAPGLSDTETIREQYFDTVMDRLEARTGTAIRPHVVYRKSYAHSDFRQDYNAFRGNAYGLANTLRQTALLKPSLRSRKVANLFYAGQLTVPGPGVPPALISGQVCAKETMTYLNRTIGKTQLI